MASVAALHLDGHLLAAYYADAQVDVAEAARSDLPDDAILAGDDELVGRPNRVEDFVHFAAVRHFEAFCISVCCVERGCSKKKLLLLFSGTTRATGGAARGGGGVVASGRERESAGWMRCRSFRCCWTT